jgi:KaiC/GvpD/RAD55 family RecA-like ATPase
LPDEKDSVLKDFVTIPGVGMSKAKILYEAGFDTMEKLANATFEQLENVKGITKKLAEDVFSHFHKPGDEGKETVTSPQSDEELLLDHGITLYKSGKWGQALQNINDVLDKDPNNVKALLYRGDIYLAREKHDLAIESYEKVIDLAPQLDSPWVGYGEALIGLGRNSEAKACFRKALDLNPNNDLAKEKLVEDDRLKTYVGGLDEMLEGGIPARHVILVCGRAGSMKSSFAYYILYKLAENEGRKGIYLTLEQSRNSLNRHMKKLGMGKAISTSMLVSDLDDMVVIDMARLRKETDPSTIGSIDWLTSIVTQIKNYKATFGCDVVAIDSLSALYSLTKFTNPRSELFFFFEKLRELGVTVFLITEMFDQDVDKFGPHGVEEFLADGIIHLKNEKYGNRTNLFLGVMKMRETNHDRDYFPLIVEKSGFEIVRD